jgi:transposase
MKREGRDPVLEKSRWLLLRRSENLGTERHFRLRDLLRHNLRNHPRLLSQGSVAPALGLQLARLGWQVTRRLAQADHALPRRAH